MPCWCTWVTWQIITNLLNTHQALNYPRHVKDQHLHSTSASMMIIHHLYNHLVMDVDDTFITLLSSLVWSSCTAAWGSNIVEEYTSNTGLPCTLWMHTFSVCLHLVFGGLWKFIADCSALMQNGHFLCLSFEEGVTNNLVLGEKWNWLLFVCFKKKGTFCIVFWHRHTWVHLHTGKCTHILAFWLHIK